jgi:Polyketide cyclase / dehydrase and lipid transport
VWSSTHSLETNAPAAELFAQWQDTATWPEWNEGVQRIDLDGPFAAGTTGRMLLPDGDELAFTLIWVEDKVGFEDETPVPDAGIVVRVRHYLEATDTGGTRIVYAAHIDGPAADQVGPDFGPQITADFPQVMAALADRVRSRTRQ